MKQATSSFSDVFPALSVGLIAGVILTIIEISFSALIFSGDLSHLTTRGIGVFLPACVMISLVVVFLSSFKTSGSYPQDAPAVLMAIPAAAIGSTLAQTDPDAIFPTVVALMGVGSVGTAILFYIVGQFKLASLVRYMPFPVVGGFLAGTGWLIFQGGMVVMGGDPLSLATLPALFSSPEIFLWLPAIIYSLALLYVVERYSHFMILPTALAVGAGLCFLALYAQGISMEQATQMGIFFSDLPEHGLWSPPSLEMLQKVHWDLILEHAPSLFTIMLLSLLSLLLNVSGVELATKRDYDLNRELKVNGLGNLVSGLFGCSPGYTSLAITALPVKLGVYSRLVGVAWCVPMICTIIWGGDLLLYMPKPLLGAFLSFLGISFMKEWVVDAYSKLSRTDYALVLIILAAVIGIGFMEAVWIGIGLALLIFVFRFSRVPVIQGVKNGEDEQSNAPRAILDRHLLTLAGKRSWVYDLSGYLFFGSANTATTQILQRFEQDPEVKFIVLDCTGLYGVDVSAINSLLRMAQKLATRKVDLVFVEDGVIKQSVSAMADASVRAHVHFYTTRDHALEYCEGELLSTEKAAFLMDANTETKLKRQELFDQLSDTYLEHLDRLETFEMLLHEFPGLSTEHHVEKGETLLREGDSTPGIYVVHWGEVSVHSAHKEDVSGSVRRQGLSAGGVIGAWRLRLKSCSPATFVTENKTALYFLSNEALLELERTNPARAIHLYKHLLHMAGCGHGTGM